jgi:lipoprotein NlpD
MSMEVRMKFAILSSSQFRHIKVGPLSLLMLVFTMQSCGGRYQAPLDDQSNVLERERAPIYSTTGTGGGAAPAPVRAPTTAARTTGTAAIAAGVRVEPAPGVSVNVANEPGAIRRGAIGRAPIDGGAIGTSTPPPASAVTPLDRAISTEPVSSAAPTLSNPVANPQTHTVMRGDTLYSIAWRYSLDYRALALANNLAAPYTIYPNQQLNLNIGNVSNNALNSVPTIPAAPAGDNAVSSGVRPLAAEANRRVGNVPTRVVEGVVWQWPIEGRVLRTFSANVESTSKGIDIGGRRGEPVYAAADGDVVYSGRGIQGQGDLIIIRHSARHLSAYSHNSNMLVAEGARIRAGDKIAEVGTDPRGSELLHFEVRVDGKPVDPSQYLPPR